MAVVAEVVHNGVGRPPFEEIVHGLIGKVFIGIGMIHGERELVKLRAGDRGGLLGDELVIKPELGKGRGGVMYHVPGITVQVLK